MAALTRFLSAYHILNTILIAAYFLIRRAYPTSYPRHVTDYFDLTWEQTIFIMIGLVLFRKYRASATLDQFIGSAFLFLKTGCATLIYMCDSWPFAWYMVFIVVLALTVRPSYAGPGKVRSLTRSTLETEVVKGDATVTWLVMFTTLWSSESSNLVPVFADLSLRFTTATVKFASLDVSLYPEVAKEYNITPGQPTFVLFEVRKPTKQLPPLDNAGERVRVKIDEPGLIAVFELERRLVESTNATFRAKND